jgi:hypothetical protein
MKKKSSDSFHRHSHILSTQMDYIYILNLVEKAVEKTKEKLIKPIENLPREFGMTLARELYETQKLRERLPPVSRQAERRDVGTQIDESLQQLIPENVRVERRAVAETTELLNRRDFYHVLSSLTGHVEHLLRSYGIPDTKIIVSHLILPYLQALQSYIHTRIHAWYYRGTPTPTQDTTDIDELYRRDRMNKILVYSGTAMSVIALILILSKR